MKKGNLPISQKYIADAESIETFLFLLFSLRSDAPVVTVDQERVHTGPGMEAELTCRIHAYPRPTIVWHRAGKKLVLANNTRISIHDLEINSTIIINHTKKDNLAQYTCRATNELGFQEGNIELTGMFFIQSEFF